MEEIFVTFTADSHGNRFTGFNIFGISDERKQRLARCGKKSCEAARAYFDGKICGVFDLPK